MSERIDVRFVDGEYENAAKHPVGYRHGFNPEGGEELPREMWCHGGGRRMIGLEACYRGIEAVNKHQIHQLFSFNLG